MEVTGHDDRVGGTLVIYDPESLWIGEIDAYGEIFLSIHRHILRVYVARIAMVWHVLTIIYMMHNLRSTALVV